MDSTLLALSLATPEHLVKPPVRALSSLVCRVTNMSDKPFERDRCIYTPDIYFP